MKKILVIMLRYIGDVLLATPVLEALRKQFPSAHLAIAVNQGTEAVVRDNPFVDEVLVVSKLPWKAQLRFLSNIRKKKFDCVLDLTDGDRSALLARFSGAPVRVGFNEEHRWRGLLYSSVVKTSDEPLHRIERNLKVLRPLGIEYSNTVPLLSIPEEAMEKADKALHNYGLLDRARGAHSPLVMFQPGARYWFKAWPTERYAELADRLHKDKGCAVLIGGNGEERNLAEAISQKAGSVPIVLAGKTSLMEYAAILRQCHLFIGSDNGPMHMAASLRIPALALFGPSNPAVWGPRGGPSSVIYKGLDCRSCFHPTCDQGELSCMKRISVDEVYEQALRML